MELSLKDLNTIKQALDFITISGKDAQYLSSLQIKIQKEIDRLTTKPEPEKKRDK